MNCTEVAEVKPEGDDFWRKRGLHVMLAAHRAHGPFSAILHPLSNEERLLVSEHLRRDITKAASTLLRKEQETKAKLQTVHIKCVSLMILAACAVAYAMIYLQGVLVPFTLAIFFMFLLEPLLFALLKVPFLLGYFVPMLRPVVNNMEKEKEAKKQKRQRKEGVRDQARQARDALDDNVVLDEATSDADNSPEASPFASPATSPVRKGREHSSSSGFPSSETATSMDMLPTLTPSPIDCGGWSTGLLQLLSWRVWSLMSVVLCLAALLSSIALLIVLIIRSINDFPWKKYSESEKLQMVLEWFPQIGADPEQLRLESIMPWLMQGFLVDAVGTAFRIISMAFLTLLFLAFLLHSDVDMMDGDDYYGYMVRVPVRRYIRIKTIIAFVVTCLVLFLYWVFEVDLAFVFAILTFVLSYIPHVGYTISVLAPLPLVFLDPTKTWGDLVLVFIIPFIIHQFASNLIEPKLLAQSLDLHPIIVLLALAFWTTVWGAVGAILSVPLTAVVRLVLREFDHPYTQPVVNLLKGRLGSSLEEEQSSLTRSLQKNDASPKGRYKNRALSQEGSPDTPLPRNSRRISQSQGSPVISPLARNSRRISQSQDPFFFEDKREDSDSSQLRLLESKLKQKRLQKEEASEGEMVIAQESQAVEEASEPVLELSLAPEMMRATSRSGGVVKMDASYIAPPPQPYGDDGNFGEGAPSTPDAASDRGEDDIRLAQI